MNIRGYTIEPGADLSGADLHGANLYRANLRGADLREANLYGAKGVLSAGFDARGYHFYAVRQEEGYRVHAGCRWLTPEEAIEHWETRHETVLNKDIKRRLALLAESAQDLGWT